MRRIEQLSRLLNDSLNITRYHNGWHIQAYGFKDFETVITNDLEVAIDDLLKKYGEENNE